jgi:hypothetical protein
MSDKKGATSNTVQSFMEAFLKPPKGNEPEQIAARIRHWTDVANDPASFVDGDKSRPAVSAKRRSALQNLRRVIERHPQSAEQMMRESEAQQ